MQEAAKRRFQVRGYILSNGAAFLAQTLGSDKAERVIDAMTPTTRNAILTVRPNGWAPASALAELHRAVADIADGDNQRAFELLVSCGGFVAQEAEQGHLRLLLELITPEHFATKVPEIFQYDFTQGTLLVDVEPGRMVCRTRDLPGLDHIVCTSTGFVRRVLTSMGKSIRSMHVHGWSLAKPCEDGASFELTW